MNQFVWSRCGMIPSFAFADKSHSNERTTLERIAIGFAKYFFYQTRVCTRTVCINHFQVYCHLNAFDFAQNNWNLHITIWSLIIIFNVVISSVSFHFYSISKIHSINFLHFQFCNFRFYIVFFFSNKIKYPIKIRKLLC